MGCKIAAFRDAEVALSADGDVLALKDNDLLIIRTLVHDVTDEETPAAKRQRTDAGGSCGASAASDSLTVVQARMMRVDVLRQALVARGQSDAGLKRQLLTRLEAVINAGGGGAAGPPVASGGASAASMPKGALKQAASASPADILDALKAVGAIGDAEAAGYASLLEQAGFATLETLRLAGKDDLKEVGLKLGHALALIHSLRDE